MQFTTFKRVILLFILFLSVDLSASDIKITNFNISTGIDKKEWKAIGVSNNFDANTKKIFTSAMIHNIFPPTQFTITWYYDTNKKKVYLTKAELLVSGTKFIYATLDGKKNLPLLAGKYSAVISANGKTIAEKKFTVGGKKLSSNSKTNSCIKPTKADNELLISDMLGQFKVSKNELQQMELQRYGDDEFSLLAPSGWVSKESKRKGKLLQLFYPTKDAATAYVLLEVPIDKSFAKEHSLQEGVLTAATLIKQDLLSKGGKIALEPKVYAMPDLMAARMMFIYSKDDINILELHTLIFDGNRMFDVVLATDKNGLEMSKFLSLLASYSFWTVQSCK